MILIKVVFIFLFLAAIVSVYAWVLSIIICWVIGFLIDD